MLPPHEAYLDYYKYSDQLFFLGELFDLQEVQSPEPLLFMKASDSFLGLASP